MPELPEVETIRLDLVNDLLKKKIITLKILSPKTVKNTKSFFLKQLLNNSFEDISRRGKLLYFKIKGGDNYLLIHLKMTGQLIYLKGKKKIAGGHSLALISNDKRTSFIQDVGGELPNRYTRVFFLFEDEAQLFFNDLRRFGYLKIVNKKELDQILEKNYGPEPLTKNFNKEYLFNIFKNRQRSIKSLLLDQKIVAGLGNIYVDESLFLAGILPDRLAKELKIEEIDKLVKSVNSIIKLAIKNRGTTFKDYRDASGKQGNFSQYLRVYGRAGEKCFKCGGIIEKKKHAGRGTHYCLKCQK